MTQLTQVTYAERARDSSIFRISATISPAAAIRCHHPSRVGYSNSRIRIIYYTCVSGAFFRDRVYIYTYREFIIGGEEKKLAGGSPSIDDATACDHVVVVFMLPM